MVRNKRKLREVARRGAGEEDMNRQVFINDDLTPLRARIARILRNDDTVGAVWTIDGRIHCMIMDNGRETNKSIDSPDDLFKLATSLGQPY